MISPILTEENGRKIQWLILVIALAILGGVIGANFHFDREHINRTERDRLGTQVRVVGDNLVRQLSELNSALDSIRNDLPGLMRLSDGNAALSHRLQFMREAMTGTRAITVFDAHGTLVARSPSQFVGHNFAQRDYFQLARQGGNLHTLYIAPPFLAATKEYVLNVSKVLQNERGEFAGIILASLGPDYFKTLLDSVVYSSDMSVSLVHGDGKVIFRIADPQGETGRDWAVVPEHLKSGVKLSFMQGVSAVTREDRLMALQTIRPELLAVNTALVAVASRNVDALFAQWQKDLVISVILFVLLGLGSGIALFYQQKRQRAFDLLSAEQKLAIQQAAAAIKSSEERWSFALEAGGEGVWDWNIQTGEAHYSKRWKEMLGYADAEIGDQAAEWSSRVHPDDMPKAMAIIQDHLDGKTLSARVEMRLRCKDGSWLWTLGRGMVVSRDAENKPFRLVGTNVDISEGKRAAAELEQHRQHLESLVAARTAELKDRNSELEHAMIHLQEIQQSLIQSEKLSGLGAMVAGVSHELNTPIGNARAVSTTLLEGGREFSAKLESGLKRSDLVDFMSRVNEGQELIEKNLTRAAELIQSFKQVAVDQTSSNRRTFDLKTTIEDVLATIRPAFKHTPITIREDLTSGIDVDSYPGPLSQVLVNLMENARIHGFEGRLKGELSVRAHSDAEGHFVMTIEDNGAGIAAYDLPRIFDPFFTTRMGHGGSGLGLNIVFNIVTGLLGGKISVKSELGSGTIFTITAPLVAPLNPESKPILPTLPVIPRRVAASSYDQ